MVSYLNTYRVMKNILIISNFNSEPFRNYLNSDSLIPKLKAESSDYNQLMSTLLDFKNKPRTKYDFIIIWGIAEKIFHEFGQLIEGKQLNREFFQNEVKSFCKLIEDVANQGNQIILLEPTIGQYTRGFGIQEWSNENSLKNILAMMSQIIRERLSGNKYIYLLQMDDVISHSRTEDYNSKLWYLTKSPYSNEVYKKVVLQLKALINANVGMPKKLLICDLDDTLWGGIIGDDGIDNICLGGHSYIGEAYSDFQKSIKRIKDSGVILAIVSKNDEKIALNCIENHPEMILKKKDFVAWKINWIDKSENIIELLKALNLTASSAVFIDDNPVERSRAKQAIPDLTVIELPTDKTQYATILNQLTIFDQWRKSEEDSKRTQMYLDENERKESIVSFESREDWLKSLETEVITKEINSNDLERTTQLFNKTNQMNLTTRRMSSNELWNWAKLHGNKVYTFRVKDKFGDSGLTGILGLQIQGNEIKITDYILSCRVMGREVEECLFYVAYKFAKENKCKKISAHYIKTEKNKPIEEYLNSNHFTKISDDLYIYELNNEYPKPGSVKMIVE